MREMIFGRKFASPCKCHLARFSRVTRSRFLTSVSFRFCRPPFTFWLDAKFRFEVDLIIVQSGQAVVFGEFVFDVDQDRVQPSVVLFDAIQATLNVGTVAVRGRFVDLDLTRLKFFRGKERHFFYQIEVRSLLLPK